MHEFPSVCTATLYWDDMSSSLAWHVVMLGVYVLISRCAHSVPDGDAVLNTPPKTRRRDDSNGILAFADCTVIDGPAMLMHAVESNDLVSSTFA